MSKIRLHGSSSGYTEIAPVAASGNNTLTLPNDGTIISQDSNGAVGVTSITVGTGVTIGDGKITCDGSALTSINAAQLVGVCTAGLGNASGVFGQTNQGITVHDTWGISADLSVATGENVVTANWFRHNTINGTIGSAMSESSGIFTFPSTGIYLIKISANYYEGSTAGHSYAGFYIKYTTNNSSYSTSSFGGSAMNNYSGTTYCHASCSATFDVTDVSTHKISFATIASGGSMVISGTSTYNNFWAEFTRLGDT